VPLTFHILIYNQQIKLINTTKPTRTQNLITITHNPIGFHPW
jgi:hypothetical protein